MDQFLQSRSIHNDVLSHNPPYASNNITRRGSDWLWAVMAVMIVSMLAFIGLTLRRKRYAAPRFHYISIAITLASAFSYFVMASNLGAHAIPVEYHRGGNRPGPTREIFYVRWIEYFITFPLEILAILTLARAAKSTKLFVVGVTMFMIVCHLTGALVRNKYKWGFLVFGILAYLLVVWRTTLSGNQGKHNSAVTDGHNNIGHHADDRVVGVDHHNSSGNGVLTGKHKGLMAYLLALWLFYPICWGLSEAGNVTSLDGECVFYGILDILTKPVFAALLLHSVKGYTDGHHGFGDHRKISADMVGHNTHAPAGNQV